MKTVAFCGHGNIPSTDLEKIKPILYNKLETLITTQGATEFLLGGYGDFDGTAARVVKALKVKYPHIISTLVIPYIDRDYNKELYDGSVFPPIESVPKRFAISKRNEWMVQCADIIIAYVKYSWGGARATLEYAKRKKKEIINLADP